MLTAVEYRIRQNSMLMLTIVKYKIMQNNMLSLTIVEYRIIYKSTLMLSLQWIIELYRTAYWCSPPWSIELYRTACWHSLLWNIDLAILEMIKSKILPQTESLSRMSSHLGEFYLYLSHSSDNGPTAWWGTGLKSGLFSFLSGSSLIEWIILSLQLHPITSSLPKLLWLVELKVWRWM